MSKIEVIELSKVIKEEIGKIKPELNDHDIEQLNAQGMRIKIILDLVAANIQGIVNPLNVEVEFKTNPLKAIETIVHVEAEHIDSVRRKVHQSLVAILADESNFLI